MSPHTHMAMCLLSKVKLEMRGLATVGMSRMPIAEVNKKLKQREFSKELSVGAIKGFDTNNIPSNNPMEDYHSEAQCLMTSGYLFGIFDGHGGYACSHVVSERLLKYIAASLLPIDALNAYMNQPKNELILSFNKRKGIVNKLIPIYEESFKNFTNLLIETKKTEDYDVDKCLEVAFLQLDNDMSDEVLKYKNERSVNKELISVAKSGTVACVAHINGPNLHIANVGDCSAVLGSMSEDNIFHCKKLTTEHNFDNESEVERILQEHPPEESTTLFRMDRLLGNLAPLRSLGDFRYKWTSDEIEEIISPFVGHSSTPQNYHTPPYLSGRPDVVHHRLRPKDKFLVIASDGLWDIMTPMEVVNVVGQHMLGKVYFSPLRIPDKGKTLGEIHDILIDRRRGLLSKPSDENAATYLMRHALGGMEHGPIQDERLAFMFNLRPEFSRSIRDDITITIIYFNSDFISDV